MGFYRNEQGGFCLPGTSEDNIALHRCHRSHRRYTSIEREQHRQTEENTINAMHNMMHAMTWQHAGVLS